MATADISLRDDFRHHLPPLSRAALAGLEADILVRGCIDPLVLWKGRGDLVDGYHRYDLCTRHGKPFKTVNQEFEDEAAVFRWMEQHGRDRRSDTRTMRRYYLGARYHREKQQHGGEGRRNGSSSQGENLNNRACERIAEEEGVGHATVTRAAEFTRQVDELAAHLGDDEVKWAIPSSARRS
jgi:hypothetical protein